MRKSFKKGMAMVLAAAMVFSTPVALDQTVAKAAGTELPEAIYEYDFEATDAAKGTIEGKGTIVDSKDASHKKVFQNAEGGKRENYFQLPENVFSANADKIKEKKGVTISFALNANGKTSNFSPVFSAYAAKPVNGENTSPMLVAQGRQIIQYNAAGWCDFTAEQNVKGKNEESTAYMTDDEWHTVTVAIGEKTAAYYVDGIAVNAWNYEMNAPAGDGFFSADGIGQLKVICLGGNQAWGWNDVDPAYQFDDVKIYAEALDATQVYKLVTGKDAVVDGLLDAATAELNADGNSINLKYNTKMSIPAEDLSIKVNGEVVATGSAVSATPVSGAATYVYTPTKDGKYTFAVAAKEQTVDGALYLAQEVSTDITVLKDGDRFYVEDSALFTDFGVSKTTTDKVFKVDWKAATGVTASAKVTDKSGKQVGTTLTAPGNVTVSAEGEYTVDIVAKKDSSIKKESTTFTYKAPVAEDQTKKDKFSNITTKPLYKYTFDNAKEVTLSSKATVKDGVLNLAPTADKHGEYYAKIDSMTADDFSKGITFIADINVKAGAKNADGTFNDWTPIVIFGDGKLAQKDAAGATYRWAITEGFSSKAGTSADYHAAGYYGNEISAPYSWDYFNNATNYNKWYTIAVTVKKNEMITYVNGVQVQKGTGDYSTMISGMKKSSNNYLGASYWDADFDFAGTMDDVAVYNTVLSAADVKALNRTGTTGVTPPKDDPKKTAKVSKVSIKVPNRKAGKTIYVKKGDKVTLKATVTGTGSYSKSVTWKSSKTKVATVKNGKVTAKKAGTAKITATSKTDKSKKATITIKVSKKAVKNKALKISPAKKSLKKGKSLTIKIKKMTKKTTDKITYKSSKKSVATVDAYGKVKAKKKGKATITVKCGKKKAKLKLTVKK